MMPDPWADFPDAGSNDADPWAGYPGAAPNQPRSAPQPAPRQTKSKPGLFGSTSLTTLPPSTQAQPVDGDTIRLPDGVLRLWGGDAPELAQQGWDRQGRSFPIGQQSRKTLTDLIGGQTITPGSTVGSSYGRSVAPVTIGNQDLMQQLLREGSAFAAPGFLGSAPDRRFDYLQAERLARLNGLGVHDYYVQPPAEHRKNPDYTPLRQDIAQFFDTPTPIAGMSPAAEKRYLDLLNTAKTPDEVVSFVESQGGFKLDPKAVEGFIRSRDAARATGGDFNVEGGVTYDHLPMPLTDSGDGASGAGVRGYGQGFVAGALDELGAFPDMLGLTPGRESVWNSDRRLADVWFNNQQQNASILGYDESAHPYAYNGGQAAGALTSGFVIPYGQGARTVPQLARVGAVYGGLEGFMGTNGGLADRAQGAAIGVPVGAALNAGGGKLLELGAPAIAKGWRALTDRVGQEGSTAVPATRSAADEWADFPEATTTMAIDAEPMPSVSSELRQRDVIDVGAPVLPQRLDQPLTEAQIRATAERVEPAEVLPLKSDADEQWPAEAVQRAGNIDLSKLDTPQDISRALRTTQDRVGFDAATRGQVTQAETERLAGELGMTVDTLLSRRQGQAFNAEEALAARQLLAKSGNELVNAAKAIRGLDNPGDELLGEFRRKWMRHVAIQEQVSGATAEAGRALAQFRMTANSRAIRGDVLGALVRAGGGKDGLQDVAGQLIEAVEAGPGVFNALAEKAAKPKFRDKVSELYINMLLSGPQTHAVNMASNTLTAMAQIPEHAAAALIGGARRAVSGKPIDRVTAGELGARSFGLLQGTREGARMLARALKTGEASDFATKIEGDEFKAISGLKGEVIRVPTRLLSAEDELFKGIARRMEINGQAARMASKEGLKGEAANRRIAELSANPTDEMLESALDYGRYLTFQRPLGPVASKVSAITNETLAAKVFLPFVRTPTNLLKFAAERSPAAPLLKEWRADFQAGGARRDLAVAKSLLGTGFAATIYKFALDGRITGSAPTDPKKARLLYADGWKPYSIRIGDQWYSYKRFDPFSTTLGVAADLATLPEGMSERQRDDKTTLLVASIMGNLASKTWLSGLSDLTSALHEPDRYAGNLIERLAGSFAVPSGVAQVARTIDPVQRETGSVGEALRNRIPGLSDDLQPRRDIWGLEVVNEGGVGPDIVSPVWSSTAKEDPVNQELMGLDYAPSIPARSYTAGGKRVEWTPEQYDKLQELAGREAHENLSRMISTPEWQSMDDTARVKAAKKVVRLARENARAAVLGAPSDSWDDFEEDDDQPAATDPWADFPDAPQRDVIGGLEQAIPGIQFTSGFRTPEYQENMRARGYNPAQNSAHLSGSALDMLPPPDKSLGWLRQQVSRAEPQARLLVHDGHLHATFPDWHGAPVLGGARSSGSANSGRF